MRRFFLPFLLLFVPSIALARSSVFTTASQRLANVERVTETIRHLHHTSTVSVHFLPDLQFNSSYNRLAHRDTTGADLDLASREGVTLGLLKKSDDLKRIMFQNFASQVGGYYDYHRKALFVRAHTTDIFGVNRHVIAHEYTHALQDQHFDLQRLLPDQRPLIYRNSDAVLAHHALTEGDAVNTEALYINRNYSASDLRALLARQAHVPPSAAVPTSILRQFNFNYTTGLSFVEQLYARDSMNGVDAAYRRLPSSTYEIMHPSAYFKHWQPLAIPLHAVQGFPDWKQTDDDVQGAFGYDLVLWQYLGDRRARKVTDAYRGDRYLLLEKGTQNAMLLKSMWTSAAASATARNAIVATLVARYHHPAVQHRTDGSLLVRDVDGAVYLQSSGSALTVAFAPSVALAQRLGTARFK